MPFAVHANIFISHVTNSLHYSNLIRLILHILMYFCCYNLHFQLLQGQMEWQNGLYHFKLLMGNVTFEWSSLKQPLQMEMIKVSFQPFICGFCWRKV